MANAIPGVDWLLTPIISERGKTETMDAEAAFWEQRGEGVAATFGKFANDWGLSTNFPFFMAKLPVEK